MPTNYRYEAKNPQGKIIKGEMTANSEKQVEKIIWKNQTHGLYFLIQH